MANHPAAFGRSMRPRLRGLITSLLLVLIAIMVVRDILARRWSGSPTAPPDSTQQPR